MQQGGVGPLARVLSHLSGRPCLPVERTLW